MRRREFLRRMALTAGVPLAASLEAPRVWAKRARRGAGQAGGSDTSSDTWDIPHPGRGSADRAAERHGGPLDLPPWRYGDTSTATDTVLMFRGNPTHTFYGTGPLPDRAPKVRWRHRMIDFPSSYYGKPHVWRGTGWTGQASKLGDYVFVGSQGCHLYAFHADTGELRWRYHGGRMFKSSVCLYDNNVYIGNVDNRLRCVDASTGDVKWWLRWSHDLDSSACVVGDKLYIAGENGHARCLDPHTGRLHWKTFVGGIGRGSKAGSYGSETSPAVADGQYFCATYDGDLFCLDAATGAKRWKAKTGDDTDASPVLYDDRVYIAAEDKHSSVFCFDRETGKKVWEAPRKGGFWATPAVVDGTVYVGSYGGVMYALDADTGKERWRQPLGSPTWSSACLVDDKLVLGAFDGKLRCLDAATGDKVWTVALGGRMHSTPCIVDGRIYIGTRKGWFYCLE